jgi:hypothetical protein
MISVVSCAAALKQVAEKNKQVKNILRNDMILFITGTDYIF